MTTLLHAVASPRGAASESRQIAALFIAAFRERHRDDVIDEWDLWDGSMPDFGRDAA